MRVDVVSIFPDYLSPLGLSLAGKARASGLLDVQVHDLRSWTHDRHRTVDDTPYGGGAGMVMKPGPWGEALDDVLTDGATLVVPTPSGAPFDQATARELATRDHLVFACGRYEGIDQRVVDHYAQRCEVREISIGDYVLNGGEVAALVVVEAVARLLPGFMGNAASLDEESHEDGLLEYPVYTKPSEWRGHDVPPVLLGGDHGAIAQWRHEQAVRRTAQRRPDLAHPARTLSAVGLAGQVAAANRADLAEIAVLQLACLPAGGRRPTEAPDGWLVVRAGGRLVATVHAAAERDAWVVGGLAVVPDLRGRGIGRALVAEAESVAPAGVAAYALAAQPSKAWRRAGYRPGEAGRLVKRRGS
jgi:tRNA (guanine37-N1)-methyltransferase